ncbi:12050_t:CDS:2 [Ambispora gerdemannii]|uniref:12050_t:CDS:1 n=1 Tax=Ambispora gerdemannii TaxID=144530 RepID=A0A9N8ZWF7_9GLOM|nr:12050_t:CDS:2 [Ambispora gerdemannii]
MVKNRTTGKRYMRAIEAGLHVIGRRVGFANNVQVIWLIECFDERVRAYSDLLRREAKGITDFTLRLSYQHGRPFDIILDENQLYRNFQPIYQ